MLVGVAGKWQELKIHKIMWMFQLLLPGIVGYR